MPEYLVHSSRERARFRHPVFSVDENKLAAMDVLKSCKGVVGIKPGVSSILIFCEPEADVPAICSELEKTFPQLTVNKESSSAGMEKAPGSAIARKEPKSPKARQLELKTLFTAGLATVGLVAVGMHHAHAWAGGVFAVFAAHHVWERRARI